MTEYITKEQAQVAVLRSLQFNGIECPDVYREIDAIPPADVVKVVRCKDCVHKVENDDGLICGNVSMGEYGEYVDDDHFCSDGWSGEENE